MFSIALLGVMLSLAPFSGPPLSGSAPNTAKFLVVVHGAAGQSVRLRALDVPGGYIASFCTNLVCAPFAVGLTLPPSGRQRIELQLIENEAGARKPKRVVVSANGTTQASIAFSRAAH